MTDDTIEFYVGDRVRGRHSVKSHRRHPAHQHRVTKRHRVPWWPRNKRRVIRSVVILGGVWMASALLSEVTVHHL